MSNSYPDFLDALGARESSNNYEAVASLGYAGRYQFSEIALTMIGYYQPDGTGANDWKDGWTGKDGINSLQDWLSSPAVQDKAVGEWFSYLWNTEIKDLGLQDYLGTTINGVQVTASGLLAGAHLVGANALAEYLNSGGTKGVSDPYGTPVSEYLTKFGGYAVDPIGEQGSVVENSSPQPFDDIATNAPSHPQDSESVTPPDDIATGAPSQPQDSESVAPPSADPEDALGADVVGNRGSGHHKAFDDAFHFKHTVKDAKWAKQPSADAKDTLDTALVENRSSGHHKAFDDAFHFKHALTSPSPLEDVAAPTPGHKGSWANADFFGSDHNMGSSMHLLEKHQATDDWQHVEGQTELSALAKLFAHHTDF